MVGLMELWLPIVASAFVVWIASAIVWMALPYHKSDLGKLPDEDAAMNGIGEVPPGQYSMPHLADWSKLTPEIKEKIAKGPAGIITIANWPPNMGKQLTLWFLHLIVVSVFVGYITGRSMGGGADYLEVFQTAGATAILAHGAGTFVESIFWGRPWSTTFKNALDATIYGLLTAGIFGWLWPGVAA